MNGKTWRSLGEFAGTPEFRRLVEREFPSQASELGSNRSRRSFLKIMGASLSLAGLAGCRWPRENIYPFARAEEGRIPGVPVRYATAMEHAGGAQGLLVTSYDGRPIKIEGNPSHPINAGKADLLAQASLLELYDPDRSREVLHGSGRQSFSPGWDGFEAFAGSHFADLRAREGEGLCVLSEPTVSPTLAEMRARFLRVYPRAGWFEWEPVSCRKQRAGAALAFGRPVRAHCSLSAAEVVVSLDADFLFEHPAALLHAREFATGRRGTDGRMNRLHVVESGFSVTGAMADHRHAIPSSAIGPAAGFLAFEVLRLLGDDLPADLRPCRDALAHFGGQNPPLPAAPALARDLFEHRGRGLVLAGPRQPEQVHALVHLLNTALGNAGRTVFYTAEDPGLYMAAGAATGGPTGSLGDLCDRMHAGSVETLLLLGGNPALTAPADLDFAADLARVRHRIHLGLHQDETAKAVLSLSGDAESWHLPRAHYLESWGDARAWDGTWSVVQPLIAPLYDGRTPAEILALCLEDPVRRGYDLARRTLASAAPVSGSFEVFWREILSDGVVPGTAYTKETIPIVATLGAALADFQPQVPSLGRENLEIVFAPDPAVYDGRFANNGWLQEIPRPLTKLTWDNALLLSPATAAELGLAADDLVELHYRDRRLEMAVYVLPGQAPFSAMVHLGGGRTVVGKVGRGAGFDVYRLRTSEAPDFDAGLMLARTGRKYRLACTQEHHAIDRIGRRGMEERIGELARTRTLDEYREMRQTPPPKEEPAGQLFAAREYNGIRWGMMIDLSTCIGCNACVAACTAENNVPIVGKKRVLEGREMQWIRIDRYFEGDPELPQVLHEPMACVQCENAPCEQVCPVGATMHDAEGLNVQVYNRCIGTRYCSNNCPYKVRRFNFFNYRKGLTPTQEMAYNPEVTIRSRGVMEKCTYCVQRIERVKISARNDERPIRDGEIVPACEQTCPTSAIVFGDLNDPQSRVARLAADPRAYSVLGELNVRPRTRFLTRLRNPLGDATEGMSHHRGSAAGAGPDGLVPEGGAHGG